MAAADWGTVVAALTADLRNLVSADAVKRSLVESIRHHRNRRLGQSEATFSFALADGVADYAPGDDGGGAGSAGDYLPQDFQQVIGDRLFAETTGTDHRTEVFRVTPERMEQLRSMDPGESQVPEAWDVFGGKLRVWPTPDESATLLEGRYQLDLGVPIVQYVGGAFKYYEPRPDHTTEITDAWAPGWFHEHNVQMIEAYAKHLLWKQMKDYEAADQWLQTWGERLADIQDEVEGLTGPLTITPWPDLSPSYGE